jgi:hypothetical protein
MVQPRFSLNLTEDLPAGHTVADIFDAVTAARPCRGPIPVADAIAEGARHGDRWRVLLEGPARTRVLV